LCLVIALLQSIDVMLNSKRRKPWGGSYMCGGILMSRAGDRQYLVEPGDRQAMDGRAG
jgi:hypothetical protein